MHVSDNDIHPGLRRSGKLIRKMPVSYSPRMLRVMAAMMKAADVLGVWPGKRPKPKRIMLSRSDGSQFRVAVFEPFVSPGTIPLASAPVVMWIHGGGFAIGAPCQEFGFIDHLRALGATVIAPSYRLSVDAPFPAAFGDCYQTLLWAYETFVVPESTQSICSGSPEVASRPLVVGGDSAGGGLCVSVCLKARDERSVPIAYHIPLYPMLDDRAITPSSQNNDAPVWNSQANKAAWRMYLADRYGLQEVSAYAAPARADDFSSMPPGCTYVGNIEPFRDETHIYVDRLLEVGVQMDLLELPGCFHGFDIVCPSSEPAKQAAEFLEECLRKALG